MKKIFENNIFLQIFILTIFSSIFIKQASNKSYNYYTYTEIMNLFENLSKTCSNYIRIDTSQQRYNLDSVPGCGQNNCTNLIVYFTNFDTFTLDRPVYYISGLVHGDEEVGPTSIVEFILYFCNESNNKKDNYYSNEINSLYHNILQTKLIIFTPMTNAYGYYNEKREDRIILRNNYNAKPLLSYDPNRDFPYIKNKADSANCMRTISARTINEIFNEFIISASITFHGGTSVLGYAWGNFLHIKGRKSTEAPDYNAFVSMGKTMQITSSSAKNKKSSIRDYDLGDMTQLVYALDGGLEDWAYGGSWENYFNDNYKPIKKCKPDTFSFYNEFWDNYNDYDYKLRCLMYLAENSDIKKPSYYLLGNDNFNGNDIFNFEKLNDFYGHVPRNMRLMYSGIDLIQSSFYIDYNTYKQNNVDNNNKKLINFKFKIMGCKSLENLKIYKFSFHSLEKKYLSKNYFSNIKDEYIINNVDNLSCYWSNYSLNYNLTIEQYKNYNYNNNYESKKNRFYNTIKGDVYFIKGEGPDNDWKNQNNPDPKTTPQSHLVRSKTDKNYRAVNGNYSLNSNYYFYSYPIISMDNGYINIVDDIDSLFYQYDNDIIFIPFESSVIKNNFLYESFVRIKRADNYINNNKLNYLLSSQSEFDVSLLVLFYYKGNSNFNKIFSLSVFNDEENLEQSNSEILNKNKFQFLKNTLVKVAMKDNEDNDKLYYYETEGSIYFKRDKINHNTNNNNYQLIVSVENFINAYRENKHINNLKINGYFIRNYLLNSLLSFDFLYGNLDSEFKFFGMFSLRKESQGLFNINNGEKKSTYYCSSNYERIIDYEKESLNKSGNNLFINYNITILKNSNKNISISFDSYEFDNNQNNNKFKAAILIFPYLNNYIVFSNKNYSLNSFVNFNISEIGNMKIIGKTVYIIIVDNEKDLNLIVNFEINNNNYIQLINELNKKNNNQLLYSKCSIFPKNYLNNEYNYKICNSISKINYTNIFIQSGNLKINKLYLIIICLILFVFISIYLCYIKKLKYLCNKDYDIIEDKNNIEERDIKISNIVHIPK